MTIQLELYQQIINLTNTFTTLMCDLYAADAEGMTLAVTKNVIPNIIVTENDEIIIRMSADEYTTDLCVGKESKIFDNDMSLEDYFESARGAFDEDDWDNVTHELGTIAQQVERITQTYHSIQDENELKRQLLFTRLVAYWFSALRWLEDAEMIGLEEEVVYSPLVVVVKDTVDDTVYIHNNAHKLALRPNGIVRVCPSPMSAQLYMDMLFRYEATPIAEYYVKQMVNELTAENQQMWTLIDHK